MNIFNLFKKRRVIKIGDRYIPQERESILSSWKGVDNGYRWRDPQHQVQYCSHKTIEDAEKQFTVVVKYVK